MKQRKPTVKVKKLDGVTTNKNETSIREYEATVQDLDFNTISAKKANEERKIETNIIPFTYENHQY